MNKPFNKLTEHWLVPVLLISGLPLLIGIFYLGHEYLLVSTGGEALEFYLFSNSQASEQYLQSTMVGIISCFVLLILSFVSVRLKKNWLLVLLCLLNFSQLGYLLFYY